MKVFEQFELMQYSAIFSAVKIKKHNEKRLNFKYFFFVQNIECGYVLTSTHYLCIGSTVRNIGIHVHLYTPVYIKLGFKGVYISWTRYPDDIHVNSFLFADYH